VSSVPLDPATIATALTGQGGVQTVQVEENLVIYHAGGSRGPDHRPGARRSLIGGRTRDLGHFPLDLDPGPYTVHTLRDGEIDVMLSVHGTTGQVWYHTWHGGFVQMIEEEDHRQVGD